MWFTYKNTILHDTNVREGKRGNSPESLKPSIAFSLTTTAEFFIFNPKKSLSIISEFQETPTFEQNPNFQISNRTQSSIEQMELKVASFCKKDKHHNPNSPLKPLKAFFTSEMLLTEAIGTSRWMDVYALCIRIYSEL